MSAQHAPAMMYTTYPDILSRMTRDTPYNIWASRPTNTSLMNILVIVGEAGCKHIQRAFSIMDSSNHGVDGHVLRSQLF